MPGTNDLGPFGPGVNETMTEPSTLGDSGGGTYSWFKDCATPTSADGTKFTAQWANRVLKYIRRACDGMGIPRNEADGDRLLKAIQKADRDIVNTGASGVGLYLGLVPSGDDEGKRKLAKLLGGAGVTLTALEDGAVRIDAGDWTRLPIFPEVETASGKLAITNNNNGSVTIDAAQNVLWRGSQRVSTDTFSVPQRTLNTSANKTYHVRYVRSTGFAIRDLGDSGYNPTSAAETSTIFDSTYDDMLVARIVTNGSNVATITTLVNRDRLMAQASVTGAATSPNVHHGCEYSPAVTLDWARAPKTLAVNGQCTGNGAPLEGHAGWISARSATRYAMTATVRNDWWESYSAPTGVVGYMNFDAAA